MRGQLGRAAATITTDASVGAHQKRMATPNGNTAARRAGWSGRPVRRLAQAKTRNATAAVVRPPAAPPIQAPAGVVRSNVTDTVAAWLNWAGFTSRVSAKPSRVAWSRVHCAMSSGSHGGPAQPFTSVWIGGCTVQPVTANRADAYTASASRSAPAGSWATAPADVA